MLDLKHSSLKDLHGKSRAYHRDIINNILDDV